MTDKTVTTVATTSSNPIESNDVYKVPMVTVKDLRKASNWVADGTADMVRRLAALNIGTIALDTVAKPIALLLLTGKINRKNVEPELKIPYGSSSLKWMTVFGDIKANAQQKVDDKKEIIYTMNRIYKVLSSYQLQVLLDQLNIKHEDFNLKMAMPGYPMFYIGAAWEKSKTWASFFSFIGVDHYVMEKGQAVKAKSQDLFDTLVVAAVFSVIVVQVIGDRNKLTDAKKAIRDDASMKKLNALSKVLGITGDSIANSVARYQAAGGAMPQVRDGKTVDTTAVNAIVELFPDKAIAKFKAPVTTTPGTGVSVL